MSMISVISSATATWLPALGAIVLIGAVLSGCGAPSTQTQTEEPTRTPAAAARPEPYQPNPILLFVGSARDHQKGRVQDPTSGEDIQIFVGRTYNAASGRLCRRFRVLAAADLRSYSTNLACQDRYNQWQQVRPLLNLDNSRISITP